MPGGTGAGPAVWCHGLLPDYHAFSRQLWRLCISALRSSSGRRCRQRLADALRKLERCIWRGCNGGDKFDAILCLLSAASYSLRFAEDLEDVFPHVPFPAQLETFRRAARLGREIRGLETFQREPDEAYLQPDLVRVETEPRGSLAPVDLVDGTIILCDDGSGQITGLPLAVWEFSVSGYRLVPHWLKHGWACQWTSRFVSRIARYMRASRGAH